MCLFHAVTAQASCGSAFCSVNTQWNIRGVAEQPGWWLDLRGEYIDQEQPRHGRHKASYGANVPHEHHDELRSINRNLLLTAGYSFSRQWGVSVSLPYVSRDHDHIHNHHATAGAPVQHIPQHWAFSELGDMRVMGRYKPDTTDMNLLFGLKLPTGRFDVSNTMGEKAERSLQPGTGTIDMVLGASWYRDSLHSRWSWFTQLLWQQPLNKRNAYRRGHALHLDAGANYALPSGLGLMLQLNGLIQARDRGANAEPYDSGGEYVFFAPGLSLGLGSTARIYAIVQLPLYQDVNGVQLTADESFIVGTSFRF